MKGGGKYRDFSSFCISFQYMNIHSGICWHEESHQSPNGQLEWKLLNLRKRQLTSCWHNKLGYKHPCPPSQLCVISSFDILKTLMNFSGNSKTRALLLSDFSLHSAFPVHCEATFMLFKIPVFVVNLQVLGISSPTI